MSYTKDSWNNESGQRWVKNADLLDEILSPFANFLMTRTNMRERSGPLLDIGCGAGATTILASQLMGERGSAVGVDVSEPLVGLARKRIADKLPNVTFACADAAQWRGDAKFQHVLSRFGVMFFPEPVPAFANIRENCEADAPLDFTCWRTPAESELISLAGRIAREFLTEPPVRPEPREPGPFAFAEQDYLSEVLTASGWKNVKIEPVDLKLSIPGATPEEAGRNIVSVGILLDLFTEQGIDPEPMFEILTREMEARVGADGKPQLLAGVWAVSASA